MARRTPKLLVLSNADRVTLQRWARQSTAAYRVVARSQILLLLAEGLSEREVARELLTSRHTVNLWRQRFEAEGVDSLLKDRPGRGRRRRSA